MTGRAVQTTWYLSLICLLAGCTGGDQPSTANTDIVAAHRADLLLDAEPDGALDVLQVRAILAGDRDTAGPPDEHQPLDDEGHGDHDSHTSDDGHDDESDHESHDGDGHAADSEDDGHGHENDSDGEAHDASEQSVVVSGRIAAATPGGTTDDSEFPWHNGRAAFVITDKSFLDHSHSHGHDDHDCPYSSVKLADAQAVVQFVDNDGQPLPIDARELFELTGDEIVVVTGQARLSAGLLMVRGDAIYVRR